MNFSSDIYFLFVICYIYNETLGVSVITVILPAWYQAMSLEERKKPLVRAKLSVLVYASSLLLGFGLRILK